MPTLGTETILMIAVVAALLAVLLVIKLIAFFNEYNKETQYIRIEMNETQDLSEQRYWQQKQSYHRLCLIPFVTENNVEKVYSALHGGRHARATQKSIMRMLVPMILGLSVCLVSLSGLTYAWFTATLGAYHAPSGTSRNGVAGQFDTSAPASPASMVTNCARVIFSAGAKVVAVMPETTPAS